MKGVRIQKLQKKDFSAFLNAFSELINTQFPEYSEKTKQFFLRSRKAWSRQGYKRALRNRARVILVAKKESKIIGILDSLVPFGGVSMGAWVMVDPQFQRQGIGTALLLEWETVMRKKGAHSIFLYTKERNLAFYTEANFERVGFYKNSWFGNDLYIFSKTIQESKEENFLR